MRFRLRLGSGTQGVRVLLPWPVDQEWVEHPHRDWQEALHVGAVGLVERVKDHPEGDASLVTRHLGEPMLTQGVPLLLRERHSSERDDVLLLIVEVSLGYHIELVKRCRQRLPGLGGRLFAPGRARRRRGVQRRPDKLVLVLDFFRHRRLLGHTLDELRVQQLVFALVMDVQRRDAEIDVIGQEPNPPW
jgi:hypothetical protein